MTATLTAQHPAVEWLEQLLLEVGSTRGHGRNGKFQCPAHARSGDHALSLSVGTRDDGRGAWLTCFAGCTTAQVLHALGLQLDALTSTPRVSPAAFVRCRRLERGFPSPRAAGSTASSLGFRFESAHEYAGVARKVRLRHPTTREKRIIWESRNANGEWVPGLCGRREADLGLYRQRDVAMGLAAGEPILLVESESSVDALTSWYATTWPGGASSPPLVVLHRVLGDHTPVVVIADADEAGRACARRIRGALPHTHVIESTCDGEDARDLLRRLGRAAFAAEIAAVVTGAPRHHTREVAS